jgi:hypothetical protein
MMTPMMYLDEGYEKLRFFPKPLYCVTETETNFSRLLLDILPTEI